MRIPNGPDQRRDQLKRMGAVAICMGLLMAAFYIYASSWHSRPEPERNMNTLFFGGEGGGSRPQAQTGPDWLYTEQTRLGAYNALQSAGQAQLEREGALDVFWRSNVHHVEGKDLVFVGFVETSSLTTGSKRMAYKATVRAYSPEEFDVISFSVAPADEAAQHLQEHLLR